jgi:hypothetical protein
MKAYSADLMALLASGVPIEVRTLFAIGPVKNGQTIYATDSQLPVKFGGNTYQPSQFGAWSRGSVTTKIGLESNSCDLTVFADNQVPVYFPGTSSLILLLDGIKYGLLGDANVTVYTLYNSSFLPGYAFPALTGPTGGSLVETKFVGQVANIGNIGMTKAQITVQDMMYLLNIQVPRRVFQASCSHTLYDAGCTLAAATFTKTGAVASVLYPYLFTTTAHLVPTSANGTFTQGVLTWLTGANAGLSYFVRMWGTQVNGNPNVDELQLDVQPISAIQAGDTFSIRQGCNKTLVSCTDLQGATNAMTNYGGQPATPVPEAAIGQ